MLSHYEKNDRIYLHGLLNIDEDLVKTIAGLMRVPGYLDGLRRKRHFRDISSRMRESLQLVMGSDLTNPGLSLLLEYHSRSSSVML